MIRVAQRYGLRERECVAGTGLTDLQLRDPSAEIAGQQELAVLRNILRLLGPSVAFGLEAGLEYHTTTHGMWGLAIMSSTTVGTAVDVGQRYSDLSFSFNRLGFDIVGRTARFLYDDSDNPDDLRAVLVERDMGALVTFGRDTMGGTVPCISVQVRGRRPRYTAVFEELFNVTPQFEADVNCVAIDVAWLDARQPLGDELALRVCEDQCRALLERRKTRSGVAGRVFTRITQKPGEFPKMRTVATELGMSTRTLRNQLAREHTSFRQLIEQTRVTMAEELLTSGALTIDEIGQRLGYADTSSFITAFKRWKGVPPRGYRTSRESSAP